MNSGFSPPSNITASQYTAASGSEPRTDLINALIIIANNGLSGNDYDISSGSPIELYQIIEMVLKIMNQKEIKINYSNVRNLGDIKEWYGDPEKINNLGFKQKVDLYDGLKRTIKYN